MQQSTSKEVVKEKGGKEDEWYKANDRIVFGQKIHTTEPLQNFRKLPTDPSCKEFISVSTFKTEL
jgi:hypothetical protein